MTCVCTEPRCTIINNNGHGRFEIHKAELTDTGLYSCEALSNLRQLIHNEFTIVTIRGIFNLILFLQ